MCATFLYCEIIVKFVFLKFITRMRGFDYKVSVVQINFDFYLLRSKILLLKELEVKSTFSLLQINKSLPFTFKIYPNKLKKLSYRIQINYLFNSFDFLNLTSTSPQIITETQIGWPLHFRAQTTRTQRPTIFFWGLSESQISPRLERT